MGSVRRRRGPSADRVRERLESDAVESQRQAAGDERASGARREPLEARAAASGREPAAGADGGGGRRRVGLRGASGDPRPRSAQHDSGRVRDRTQPVRAGIHPARGRADEYLLRPGARAAQLEPRSRQSIARGGPRAGGEHQAGLRSQEPRRVGSRPRAHAPGRREPPRAHVRHDASTRFGLFSRQTAHAARAAPRPPLSGTRTEDCLLSRVARSRGRSAGRHRSGTEYRTPSLRQHVDCRRRRGHAGEHRAGRSAPDRRCLYDRPGYSTRVGSAPDGQRVEHRSAGRGRQQPLRGDSLQRTSSARPDRQAATLAIAAFLCAQRERFRLLAWFTMC